VQTRGERDAGVPWVYSTVRTCRPSYVPQFAHA